MRTKLMIILALSVTLPVVGSGYLLIHRAEQALLLEKENKLFGIARALDNGLPGDFNSLLPLERQNTSKEEKIRLLNTLLAEFTDELVKANPGVGAGYYSKDLDAIITYGPSSEYRNTIGQAISPQHKGREVMSKAEAMAVTGPMVRGNILNAMVPLVRNGQVIGYAWANELTESVVKQIQTMAVAMYVVLGFALVVGLGIALPIANGISGSVQKIIDGLRRLRSDLAFRLPETTAEFGEITTAINEMADSLMNTRSHTEIIIQSMADGVITVGIDGKITALNDAACRITGLTREVIGRNYPDFLQTDEGFHSLLLETLATGKVFISYDVEFPHMDGGKVFVSASTSLLANGSKVIGAVVVFKDLTERKIFEEQVRRLDRLAAVGELAAGVAHEIRNPLTAISGSVQILLDELVPENPSRLFGDVVVKEIQRLNKIVEDLLYFAKPSKNYISLVDPNDLVRETVSLLTPSLKKELVTLNEQLDPGVEQVPVDAGLIKQVLVNLLLNAIQALRKQGGEISVVTLSVPHGVEIQVIDNGVGISPEDLPRIFDPFFTTKDRGTGLGLAVSSKIIEIHQGNIRVESKIGQGSTIILFLPSKNEQL